MESDRRKVYVEVNVTHRPDGTARPNFIKFENDEKYEIDRVIQKCRAASTKVGGTGIRYTVQICGKPTFLFDEENDLTSKRLPTNMFRHIWHFPMSVTHKYTELTRSFSWRRFSA